MQNSKPNGWQGSTPATPTDGKPEPIMERSFRFAVEIVKLGVQLERHGNVGRVLASQLLRAGTAIGSQVEEAQAAESKADFVSKLAVGLKEAREAHYRLRVLVAAGIFAGPAIERLSNEADELKRILAKIIVNTKRGHAGSPELRTWAR